jgi:hypothetical protein
MIMQHSKPLKRSVALTSAFFVLITILTAGCSGGASPTERLDEVRGTYYEGVQRAQEVTAFLEPMAAFNLEDKGKYEDLRSSLQGCVAAAGEARANLDEIGAYDYSGKLKGLGEYIMEYKAEYEACLDEIGDIYIYLDSVLKTLEPYIQMKAGIPQLSSSESLKQNLQPMQGLKAEAESVTATLAGMEPPTALSECHALLIELFQAVSDVLKAYISIAMSSGNIQDVSNNPVVVKYLGLQARYQQLVPGLYKRLRIAGIDPFMEKVELEINRLYLGGEAGI